MSKQRELYYSPLLLAGDGELTLTTSDTIYEGYFEYWGPSSELRYIQSEMGNIPVALPLTLGFVQDKLTGKVHACMPWNIKFKLNG